MNTNTKKLLAALLFSAFAGAGITACEQNDGPAEQLGEKVDEAAQDTKRAVDDATD